MGAHLVTCPCPCVPHLQSLVRLPELTSSFLSLINHTSASVC